MAGRALAALLLAVLCCCCCLSTVHAKVPSIEGTLSGNIQCPCFCSARHSGLSPYWDHYFGSIGARDGDTCGAACQTGTFSLPFCAEHVTYRFCPRAMTNDAYNGTTDEILAFMDNHVKACTEDLVWEDDDTECRTAMKRAACNFAFPKCDSTDTPLPLCGSTCQNEILACRSINSNFGSMEQLEGLCGTEVGPSDTCTGAAAGLAPAPVVVLAATLAAAAAAAVLHA